MSFGGAYARVSNRARALDSDAVLFGGSGLVRNLEALFEANYQAQILPGLQIDFDVQRIVNPGGHIANPSAVSEPATPDATVLTLHTSIKY